MQEKLEKLLFNIQFFEFQEPNKTKFEEIQNNLSFWGVDEYVGIFSFLALENYSNLCGTYQVTRAEQKRTEASKQFQQPKNTEQMVCHQFLHHFSGSVASSPQPPSFITPTIAGSQHIFLCLINVLDILNIFSFENQIPTFNEFEISQKLVCTTRAAIEIQNSQNLKMFD